MIKLIASDLDGTLLKNGAQKLNPVVFDLIRGLKEHGILFVSASGRQYANQLRLFDPVKDDIAYIAENGSLSVYRDKILSKSILSYDLGVRIIEAIRSYPGCDCIVSGERVCYTDSKNPAFMDHMVNVVGNDMQYVNDLTRDIDEPFLKVSACDFNGAADCQKYFQGLFSPEIKVTTSGNIWADFIIPGADKGTALSSLLEQLKIEPEDCMAFGDQYNDLDMLKLVGTSYAVSTAAPGLGAYCTHVTDSVEDTIAEILASLSTDQT